MSQKAVYVVQAVRTPIGAFAGSLKSLSAVDLGVVAVKELLARASVAPDAVDELNLGCILQTGCGQGVSRQVAIKAGMPQEATSETVNMLCGSGMRTIVNAVRTIRAGDAGLIVAGGTESMSRSPHFALLREPAAMGTKQFEDTMIRDGLTEAFSGLHMGMTAENLATKYGISREEQDAFALDSQMKAARALETGRFADEIVPVPVPQRKGDPVMVAVDEHPKPKTTMATLASMKPAFKKDGTVTAGNASGINDGAAVLLLADEDAIKNFGLVPLARVAGYGYAGVDPQIMGIGPVPAVKKALANAGWNLGDVQLIEANEAFAAQALSVGRELEWDPEKVNVNGGAIALGHPIGASGARIVVTLLHEMKKRALTRGLATLCIGGGMGIALCLESV